MANEVALFERSGAPATLEQYAQNLNVKLQMAGTLLKSGLIPAHFKTPEAVLTAILYGQEIDMSPMQSLLSVTVIQGKPCLDAAGLKAKCLQAGGRFETIEWTDKTCKLRGIRGEWKEEVEFTMGDAEKMGLAGKDNWRRMPKAMLYARAVSIVIRNMFADVIKGFYSKEEMLDSVDITPAPKVVHRVVDGIAQTELVEPIIESKDPIDYCWYAFPEAEGMEKKQLEFLKRRNCEFDIEKKLWFCPKELGGSREGYRTECPYLDEGEATDNGDEVAA